MSQDKEYNVLHGKARPPARWSGTLLAGQYVKMLEIKYSRLSAGAGENSSFCKILCEALDALHAKESKAGKITVRVEEYQGSTGKG